jgi:hypothetical protein
MHPQRDSVVPGSIIGMKLMGHSVASVSPGPFSVESTITKKGVEMMALWDNRAVSRDQVDMVFEEFEMLIRGLDVMN